MRHRTLPALVPSLALALALALAIALATTARAETLEDKYKKKLAAPFLKNAAWVTDFDAAKKKAAASGQVLFAYFTRSFAP